MIVVGHCNSIKKSPSKLQQGRPGIIITGVKCNLGDIFAPIYSKNLKILQCVLTFFSYLSTEFGQFSPNPWRVTGKNLFLPPKYPWWRVL
jgi:hypothetical protein